MSLGRVLESEGLLTLRVEQQHGQSQRNPQKLRELHILALFFLGGAHFSPFFSFTLPLPSPSFLSLSKSYFPIFTSRIGGSLSVRSGRHTNSHDSPPPRST